MDVSFRDLSIVFWKCFDSVASLCDELRVGGRGVPGLMFVIDWSLFTVTPG